MEFTIELKEWCARQNACDENKFETCTMTFGHCNRTMQNRIEETNNFESTIQNDPFLLLCTIKLKMCGQVRAKCECVQPADAIPQFSSLKQEHGESPMDVRM